MREHRSLFRRIVVGLQDLRAVLRSGGIGAACRSLHGRIFRRSVTLLYSCRVPSVGLPDTPGLTIERVTGKEADTLHDDLCQAGAGDDLRLFARGAICYLARWAGQPVGAGWLFKESYLLRRAGCEPAARYLGAFQVVASHRGKGIYSALLRTMAADVMAAGGVPYVNTTEDNIASRRGIEKAGFTCEGELHALIVLGLIIRCKLHPHPRS